MKSLVAYFSAESGKTRNIAKALAEQTGSTLFEIVPEKPYTEADLKWTNPLARCNREKIGKKVYVFATSGGSGIGKTAQKLEPFMKGAGIADAKRVAGVGELSGWTR